MNEQTIEEKIKRLEDRVSELERRPIYYPVYTPAPQYPQPFYPYFSNPVITCSGNTSAWIGPGIGNNQHSPL